MAVADLAGLRLVGKTRDAAYLQPLANRISSQQRRAFPLIPTCLHLPQTPV